MKSEIATVTKSGTSTCSARLTAAAVLLAAVSLPAFGQPSVVSTAPSSGSGSSHTFAVTVADSSGATAISTVFFLVNSSGSGANACFVEFNRAANTFRLLSDSGSVWLGPITLGATTSVSNSQCAVNAATGFTSASGNNLTVRIPLNFASTYSGAKSSFVQASDANTNTGWVTTGTWTVTAAGSPTVLSTVPASGSGPSQTFTVTAADGAGSFAISTVYLLVNNSLSGVNACFVAFNQGANTFALLDDSGSVWLGPVTLGTTTSVSNSQCAVSAAGGFSTPSVNNLTVHIPLSFTYAYSGAKSTSVMAIDNAGKNSGWVTTGAWTVPGSGAPRVLSTVPALGSGASQTFTVTTADGGGSSAISTLYFLINNSLSGAHACFVAFDPAANAFNLLNDSGSAWVGSVALGASTPLSNSQCTVNAAAGSKSTSGTNLTVSIPLTFTLAFNGPKNSFVVAYDAAGNSGWVTTGSWTVQVAAPPPVPEPMPPPFMPSSAVIGGFNTLHGTLRAKASPDECFQSLGTNVKWDFINQENPLQPCAPGKVPKVNQGYIWGSTIINGIAYFGTQANAECIAEAVFSTNPAPYQTDTWACEFGVSPYAQANGGPLPAVLGDQRPPRMYSYNISTHVVTDITPKLGGNPGAFCSPGGPNPLCVDQLWLSVRGVRTATAYTEPATGKTFLIVSGPAIVQGSNALNFFAYDIAAQQWVAKYQYIGYSDMRHWLTVNGVLYAPVGKPSQAGGAMVRYTGNFANLPVPPVPGPGNNYNQIAACGTTSSTIPPQASPTSQCFSFQDVGDFDGVGTDVVLHEGRLFAATWPPPSAGSLWMSPPIPNGGFGGPTQNPPAWTKVWDLYTNYDPDPLLATTIGTGALADFNGTLYWGTMVYGVAGTLKWFQTYGTPATQQAMDQAVLNTFRTAVLFSGTNFTSGSPTINLLYGQATFKVWNPTTKQWVLTPNKMPNKRPLYGPAGFGNPYNNYIWTMAIFNNKLWIGTMDWGYTAADSFAFLKMGQGQPVPNITRLIPPSGYGADLWSFSNTSSPATAESINGVGNYLNYGIRSMMPNGTSSILFGTANPMNTATTSTTAPHGGWELIEAVP